jgi:site-specific recombinase XerD
VSGESGTENEASSGALACVASELVPRAVSLPPDRSPVAVYLARLSAGSRPTMLGALGVVAGIVAPELALGQFPFHLLRYPHVQAIRTTLAERYAPATANKILAALRGVLREAWRLDLMPMDALHRAVDVEPVQGSRVPKGRALAPAEVAALLAACDPSTRVGARDAALVAVLYGCGLRRSEAVGIDVRDLDPHRGTLRVRGKGNKERMVPVSPTFAPHLARWIGVRAAGPGALFLAMDAAHRGERLSDDGVLAVLKRLGKRAGIEPFSPHDMRRSFVSNLLDAGADIATVQKLAGHSQVTTTQRYDRRGEDAMRKAVALLR